MRDLIGQLPVRNSWGQHRECCALRGNGWGKKHATVDYVFTVSPYVLYQYHTLIMDEMERRGYNADARVERGFVSWKDLSAVYRSGSVAWQSPLYKEHDDAYYKECIENLAQKGIILEGENHV